jgi:hypothetical protein
LIEKTTGLFGYAFERFKSAFNTQKVHLEKKKNPFSKKKNENTFNGPKSLKMTKRHFWQKLYY